MDRQSTVEEELRDQIYRVSREAQGRGRLQTEFDQFIRDYRNRCADREKRLGMTQEGEDSIRVSIFREILSDRDKADSWSQRMGETILSHEKALASALASARMAAMLTNVEEG